ncbi:zinc-binding dehydrogenase [Ramlibacter sp.]|uniref:zinc-binding dehydrogenase n=1 Tax=Ramlibacter sp. TaxID=1917967 RepID=UPI003D0E490F
MKAIVIDESSPGRELHWQDVPDPEAGPHELLVAVRAAGLNRADLRRAASHFAASEGAKRAKGAAIAGLELAGEVVSVGADVDGFAVGDRVMAMAGSAFAERVAVDHRFAFRIPLGMSWESAASVPISFVTGHDALATAGRFAKGQSVLVLGASTGAGIATVQIARHLGASIVFGTAGTPAKLERLRSLGCDVPIDYRSADIAAVVRERTEGRGVDVVIDYAGGPDFGAAIDAAAVCARIVCAGRVAGTEAKFNIDEFSRKRIEMVGVTNRTRTLEQRVAVVQAFEASLGTALATGALRPIVDSVQPMAEAEAAYARMALNAHFGKMVLMVG